MDSWSEIELVWSKKRQTVKEKCDVVCWSRLSNASETGIDAGCWIVRGVDTICGSSRRGSYKKPKRLKRCLLCDSRRSS